MWDIPEELGGFEQRCVFLERKVASLVVIIEYVEFFEEWYRGSL